MQGLYLIRFFLLELIAGLSFLIHLNNFFIAGVFICAIGNMIVVLNSYSQISDNDELRKYVIYTDHLTPFVGSVLFSACMYLFAEVWAPMLIIPGFTSGFAIGKLVSYIYARIYK